MYNQLTFSPESIHSCPPLAGAEAPPSLCPDVVLNEQGGKWDINHLVKPPQLGSNLI